MGRPAVDITGQRYGRVVVLRRVQSAKAQLARWRYRCDCGTEGDADGSDLRRGNVRSCGCLRAETMARANRKHGDVGAGNGTPEYQAWLSMRKRCYYPRDINFKNYGARGITVCVRWRESFEAFLADMGRRPSPEHSVDRKDNDGNYEPGNCHWATPTEQARNRRRSPQGPDGRFVRGSR